MLSKSICVSSKLAKVRPFTALLFTWSITHCDDGGNMVGDPFTVKGLVVPVRPETTSEVASALTEMEEVGLIKTYLINEKTYLHINQFEKHQTLRRDRATWLYPDQRDDNQLALSWQPTGNRATTKGQPDGNLSRSEGKVSKGKLTKGNINTLESGLEYLDKIPIKDIEEWMKRFVVSEDEIKSTAEDLKLYCQRRGRVYRNYRAFLLNAIKRNFKEKGKGDGKFAKI